MSMFLALKNGIIISIKKNLVQFDPVNFAFVDIQHHYLELILAEVRSYQVVCFVTD